MSFKIITTAPFLKDLKRLSKRYPNFKKDVQDLQANLLNNPMQGVEVAPNIRKIRMSIRAKGRGKSGGARVITFNALISEIEGTVYLITIYDKSDASNVKMNVIMNMIRELGL